MTATTEDPGRYHLLLTTDGRSIQHGWWGREDTARDKFLRAVGLYGSRPDARVTLTDEETGDQLAVWPDDSPGVVSGAG